MPARMPASAARARVGQHLAGEDLRLVRDAVARLDRRALRAHAVPMQCVPCPWPSWTSSPAMNDFVVTARPAKSGWVRSKPVSSTATLDAAARAAAVDDLRRLQPPGRLGLVERRGDRLRAGRLGGEAGREVQDGLAVAAQVLRAERPALRRRGRPERRRVGIGSAACPFAACRVVGGLERVDDPLGLHDGDRGLGGRDAGLPDLLGRRVDHGDAERREVVHVRGGGQGLVAGGAASGRIASWTVCSPAARAPSSNSTSVRPVVAPGWGTIPSVSIVTAPWGVAWGVVQVYPTRAPAGNARGAGMPVRASNRSPRGAPLRPPRRRRRGGAGGPGGPPARR